MIKYTILLLNMLAIIFARMFFDGDVSVKVNMPAKVKQGEEITVSLTINKGSIAGVGHMKQELPAGFSNAVVVDAKGAEFKYLSEDNVIKFTWISLPPDQEFTVSYKVTVNADAANGTVNMGGKFSYVLNNEKQTFLAPETSIQVGGEVLAASTKTEPETTAVAQTQPETTAVAPVETTTIEVPVPQPAETTAVAQTQPDPTPTETAKTETPAPPTNTTTPEAKTSYPVVAARTIVGSPEAGMEFTVEINVKKDGMKGFARIQEILPAGFTAMSLENKGGTFSFLDQKVKIIWDNLPADEDIKVSYRVMVAENISGDQAITGAFSYVENDDPKKAEIASSTISVKAKEVSATNTTTEPKNTNTTETATNQTTASNTTTVPAPEDKVSYKVQICALSKIQRGTSYFESKYAISNKVSMELHEGWKKYIVGKYNAYKDARDYREAIRSKGVENPFVTAYNSGKRITIQEALMVSNQQWVR